MGDSHILLGRTMTLISVDANTINLFIMMGTFMFSSPVMIVVSMGLIIAEVGPIGIVTPLLFLAAAFFQNKINALVFRLRR